MMHSSIMICCCWSALSSVHRPWRIRLTTERIEGIRDVKGAATLASPGRTMGTVASSRPWSGSAFSPSVESKTLPYLRFRAWASLVISCRTRSETFFTASIMPIGPTGRPASWRRCSSSWIQVCCCFMISCRFLSRSALRTLAASLLRLSSFLACAFSSSSARDPPSAAPSASPGTMALASGAPASSVVLALPYPDSNARPTSACFSAPTSLPPSPHMSTWWSRCRCRNRMTLALPWGEHRAKTRMAATCSQTASPCACPASSSTDSSTTKSWLSDKAPSPAASKGTVTCLSRASMPAHWNPPSTPWRSRVNGGPGFEHSPTFLATCSAVRGASPVSMDTSWEDWISALITVGESDRVLHVNAMNPAKSKSLSTQPRRSSSVPEVAAFKGPHCL
mmetsp:Transcript_27225/g.79339  ORF Transcript_27225/g.79339 Transcript_27225/m.79339 type:complete len:394 (-) Transcript_27225:926-2107(-)